MNEYTYIMRDWATFLKIRKQATRLIYVGPIFVVYKADHQLH